jgi:alanyl-tRNA synthetase
VVIIDPNYSIELCGGTHVSSTGELGFFKIKHESAVAAGVRRIEAVSGNAAETFINEQLNTINTIRESLKHPKEINKAIDHLVAENNELKKKLESVEAKQLIVLKDSLLSEHVPFPFANTQGKFIGKVVDVSNADHLKKLCFDLKNDLGNDYAVVLAANINGKASVAIMLSDSLVNEKGLEAPKIIKEYITPIIKGGGGGQKTLATAGGQDANNLQQVIDKVKSLL